MNESHMQDLINRRKVLKETLTRIYNYVQKFNHQSDDIQ